MRTIINIIGLVAMGLATGYAGSLDRSTPSDNAGPTNGNEVVMIHEQGSGAWSPNLTDSEKAVLFKIAEDTLSWCVLRPGDRFSFEGYALTPALKREMATFVTLKIGDRLRGCIGSLAPVAPLYRSVHDNVLNAALRDFRFQPVSPKELDRLDVHISLLSPIVELPSLDDFRIGEHGIIIEKGTARAVYLPEVAVEQNWTKEETLSSLSQKAGLPADAWRQGANFKVFSSVVLSQ